MLAPVVAPALGAAVLFGLASPCARFLVGTHSPQLLAGLFYFGSGVALAAWRMAVPGGAAAPLTARGTGVHRGLAPEPRDRVHGAPRLPGVRRVALAAAAACLFWALDNNLTSRVSGTDPVRVAAAKDARRLRSAHGVGPLAHLSEPPLDDPPAPH